MICCKIIADYKNSHGNFQLLLDTLANYGDFLWDNGVLFFSEVESSRLTERKIINILKKSGYSKYYLDIYNQDNPPQEATNVNIWLTNKLIKINYNQYQQESQAVFRDINMGLNMLDQEIKTMGESCRDTCGQQNNKTEAESHG